MVTNCPVTMKTHKLFWLTFIHKNIYNISEKNNNNNNVIVNIVNTIILLSVCLYVCVRNYHEPKN